jgi:hypothetical protein
VTIVPLKQSSAAGQSRNAPKRSIAVCALENGQQRDLTDERLETFSADKHLPAQLCVTLENSLWNVAAANDQPFSERKPMAYGCLVDDHLGVGNALIQSRSPLVSYLLGPFRVKPHRRLASSLYGSSVAPETEPSISTRYASKMSSETGASRAMSLYAARSVSVASRAFSFDASL